MNIKEAIGIVNYDKDAITGEEVSFEEQYNRLIDFLGGTNAVMKYVPLTKEKIRDALAKDKNLNNIPLRNWDRWAGFEAAGSNIKWKYDRNLRDLFRAKGITCYSPSQLVSTLKQAARRYAEEN